MNTYLKFKALTVAATLILLVSCESRQTSEADAADPEADSARPAKKAGPSFEPPPERLALPARLREIRDEGGSIGTVVSEDHPEPRPLAALGLNVCQTGWVLQGFVRKADGSFQVTPAFHIQLASIPEGRKVRYTPPGVDDKHLLLDFEKASLDYVKGSFAVVSDAGETLLKLEFDGEPTGAASGPGLGQQGCFTTGYYRLTDAGDSVVGPVTAVWDRKDLYYVGIRLTPRHNLAIFLTLRHHERRAGSLMRGGLARLVEAPGRYPFRIYFEERKNNSKVGEETGPKIGTEQKLPTEGEFYGSFVQDSPEGPIRLVMKDVKFPDWDGPLAGETVDLIQAEARFVTKKDASIVPVPKSKPDWAVIGDLSEPGLPKDPPRPYGARGDAGDH